MPLRPSHHCLVHNEVAVGVYRRAAMKRHLRLDEQPHFLLGAGQSRARDLNIVALDANVPLVLRGGR